MKIRITEIPHWNYSDVHQLKLSMLKQALEEIADRRRSIKMRDEAREWLFDENPDNPFSARKCAIAGGYDIDRLRELLSFLTRYS